MTVDSYLNYTDSGVSGFFLQHHPAIGCNPFSSPPKALHPGELPFTPPLDDDGEVVYLLTLFNDTSV